MEEEGLFKADAVNEEEVNLRFNDNQQVTEEQSRKIRLKACGRVKAKEFENILRWTLCSAFI